MTQSNALSNQLSTHDTDIKSLLNNRGCVKSVQRGYRSVAGDEILSNKSISINISPINPNKSLLLIDVPSMGDGYGMHIFFNLLQSSIVVGSETDVRFNFVFSYQVVEFY